MLCPILLFFFFFFLLSPLQSDSSPISITLTPKLLRKSGDSVRIQWTGIPSPSKLDWLGIYSPPNSSNSNFIGYMFLSSFPNWRSGSSSATLPMVNLRSNYEFRIFRWTENEVIQKRHDHDGNPLPITKHLLVRSGEVGFEAGRGPEQIHLAFTESVEEMRVMFVMGDGRESYVRYGDKEGELSQVGKSRVMRYERRDMCDAPANQSVGWRDPGFIHDAVINNLKSRKRYYYKVGNDEVGWSLTHSFISRDANPNETIAFLFGDMGTSTPYSTFRRTQLESKSTIKWIIRDMKSIGDKPAFVSHIGDISYARGYSWLWDTFLTQIEPVASKLPYHVCIGNHEYDWPLQPWRPKWAETVYNKDGGGECGVPYSLRFHMPGNSSLPTGTRAPATRNLYYSFDAGVVHFVFMSTETDFLPGSSQYRFIKHDLENVERSKTPFVVFQGHRPMYTTSNELRDTPMREKLVEHMEPLFVKNKVTLALWGHVHRYERFCPLKNYTCGKTDLQQGDLPIHVVIGMAGQDWQPIWEPRPDHPNDPVFPQPARSLFRGGEFGYTRLYATKDKLTLTYIGNHDGEPHDSVEILASGGQVLSGNLKTLALGQDLNGGRGYVIGVSLLVLGGFVGYVIGFIAHAKKTSTSNTSWAPVKTEES